MENVLESLLGVDKSNPLFEVLFNPEMPNNLQIHYGMRLLEVVPRNSFPEKLLIARLFNARHNQKALKAAFKYDIKTMRSWARLLKSGEINDIIKIGQGQGAVKKFTEDKLKFINYLYKENKDTKGCHINKFIANEYYKNYNEKISIESIRLLFKTKKEEKLSVEPKNLNSENELLTDDVKEKVAKIKADLSLENNQQNDDQLSPIRENSVISSEEIGLTIDDNSNLSPHQVISEESNFPIVDKKFNQIFSCHHIGLLLSRIFLDFVTAPLGDIRNITRQWITMILSGRQNIEQGQNLNYRVLELLIGKQKTSANKQRETLKEISNKENVNLLFTQNIRLVKAENSDMFLLDPHGVAYTGQLQILKCWLGNSHSIGKGYYLDLIHTLNGEPVFSKLDDNYYDLRQRFHSVIKEFREVLDGNKNRNLTIIVDRAIYDVEFMKKARDKNVFIVTWEKNYKKGVLDNRSAKPIKTFFIKKYRNRKEDSYVYTVQYVKRKWDKENSFTQFIVQLSKPNKEPIELSILCTNPSANSQQVIKGILTRWVQENDMGYLILLGINQITSYSSYSYKEVANSVVDREVKNKELTKLLTKKNKYKLDLGKILVKREFYLAKKEDEIIELKKQKDKCNLKNKDSEKEVKKIEAKLKRIPKDREKVLKKNQIAQDELRRKIDAINEQAKNLPDKMSRLEFLIQEEYIKLNFMSKSFMDAIKITARNIIYQLLQIFRPIWNNRRNDHVILRELISSVGHIQETDKTIIVYLTPARQFSKKQNIKILAFLCKISQVIGELYKSDKTIIISLYEI